MDRLLKLIEEGDSDAILSEEELIPRFNELMKYDLVALKDEKVYLTEKGKEAKRVGVDKIIKREKQLQFENSILPGALKKRPAMTFSAKGRYRIFYLLCLLLLLLLSLAFAISY